MTTDDINAFILSPLATLAEMMESSVSTAEDCSELLRLVLAGIEKRIESQT